MAEDVDNIIIEHLKALRGDLREFRQVNAEEHNDLKARLSRLEAEVLGIKRIDDAVIAGAVFSESKQVQRDTREPSRTAVEPWREAQSRTRLFRCINSSLSM